MKRLFSVLVAGLAVWLSPLGAQSIPDSLITAATTTTDAAGRPWAYIAFTPENTGVLRGRGLAVYLKNGLPADPGSFVRQGVVSPELEMSLMAVFIERGRQIGEDLVELDAVLYDLYRTRGAERNQIINPLPTPPKPPLTEMLAALLKPPFPPDPPTDTLPFLLSSEAAVVAAPPLPPPLPIDMATMASA